MRCGRNLLRAIMEYYQVTDVIPVNVIQEMFPKKKRRPRTYHNSPRNKKRIQCRPKTTRYKAIVHFTDLNINYDSSTSYDELPYSYRNQLSPSRREQDVLTAYKKVGGGFMSKGVQKSNSPPPQIFDFSQPPSLTIIDFNKITVGSLEKAMQKNSSKIISRHIDK